MFKIFQRFPINITPLAPVGILQWIDTPQGRGGRPSGSPQSASLSPRVPEEILEQLFLSFFASKLPVLRGAPRSMFIKTDSGAFKIRFKGFSLISQSKARFTIKADNADLVTLRKNRDYVLSFWSKPHTKLSEQQTLENKTALFLYYEAF